MKSPQSSIAVELGPAAPISNPAVDTGTLNNLGQILHNPGILSISNANTTIAYCRYNDGGEVEYIFVNPSFRRKGYAKRILQVVEKTLRRRLVFQPPVSPLGRCMLDSYENSWVHFSN